MKRTLIFVFTLLATLSIINANPHQLFKRATNFGPCPIDPPVPELAVTLQPDPVVPGSPDTVSFSGKLTVDVPADSKSIVQVPFLDAAYVPIGDPFTLDLCATKGITCPIKAGTQFSGVVENVPVPKAEDMPKGTTIVVAIIDETDEFIGCSISDPIA